MKSKQDLFLQLTINVTQEGQLTVHGFPNNLQRAQQVINGANEAITAYFVGQAREGKLDDKGNVIESKIVKPDRPLLRPVGLPMGIRGRKDGMYKK